MYALNNIVLDLKQEGLLQTSECNRMDPPHAHVANTICRSEKNKAYSQLKIAKLRLRLAALFFSGIK